MNFCEFFAPQKRETLVIRVGLFNVFLEESLVVVVHFRKES